MRVEVVASRSTCNPIEGRPISLERVNAMHDLMTLAEASDRLRTPAATLRYWRHVGTGPKSFRLGGRVVYKAEDVEAWVEAQYAANDRVPAG